MSLSDQLIDAKTPRLEETQRVHSLVGWHWRLARQRDEREPNLIHRGVRQDAEEFQDVWLGTNAVSPQSSDV